MKIILPDFVGKKRLYESKMELDTKNNLQSSAIQIMQGIDKICCFLEGSEEYSGITLYFLTNPKLKLPIPHNANRLEMALGKGFDLIETIDLRCDWGRTLLKMVSGKFQTKFDTLIKNQINYSLPLKVYCAITGYTDAVTSGYHKSN